MLSVICMGISLLLVENIENNRDLVGYHQLMVKFQDSFGLKFAINVCVAQNFDQLHTER